MCWWRVAVFTGLALAAGCTKPNPRSCADGICNDPAFPFCDVDGALEGQTNTCIAVTCSPGEFTACRGDQAITCNAVGNDYELIQCERGCEVGTGCRLCDPNETACTNGTVATCDAAGVVTSKQDCPLGCFESEPRCREIDPSNGLGQYLDPSQPASDLDLSAGGTIDTATGQVRDANNTLIPVTTLLLPAPQNGAAVRVFIVGTARLGNINVFSSSTPGPALALLAHGEITVEGTFSLWTPDAENAQPLPGGVAFASCRGGRAGVNSQDQATIRTGSGGGGHATAGGHGGSVDPLLLGGAGGAASGSPSLEPLRGGCSAGDSLDGGGGAVQLSSRVAITVRDSAVINANGQIGIAFAQGPSELFGGGAGGGILLEAPTVSLGSNARLLVNGGPAATDAQLAPSVSLTTAVSAGGSCTSTAAYKCGKGGDGAALDGPASDAVNVPFTGSATVTDYVAAGGGGGLGYIRINTQSGQYTKQSDTIESGVLTTGTVRTR
ncbi:MAG TPA: hypothetical protein VFQ53_42050 [Kofleriaceae bacterium]|nr:hypothetical protein [Kofleriaceae bacterium]